MSKEYYINYPAISASRIKRYYLGDISKNKATKAALDKGAAFHYQLLETAPDEMSKEAYNVYNAICSNPMLEGLFNNSDKEFAAIVDLAIPKNGGHYEVKAKGIMDLVYREGKIIVDIKTTQCKTIEQFAKDMIEHCNQVQAIWYCWIMGFPIENFYYIGVPAKAKKSGSTSSDLFLYRHSQKEIEEGLILIYNYLEQFDGDYSK
jgi:hypothetical protein